MQVIHMYVNTQLKLPAKYKPRVKIQEFPSFALLIYYFVSNEHWKLSTHMISLLRLTLLKYPGQMGKK